MEQNLSAVDGHMNASVMTPVFQTFGHPAPQPVVQQRKEEDDEVGASLLTHLIPLFVPIPHALMEVAEVGKEFASGNRSNARPNMFNLGNVFIKHPTMDFTVGYLERKRNEARDLKLKANDEQPLYKIDRDRAAVKQFRH